MQCPTCKIKVPPSPDNEAGIVIINESDFDPKIHTKVDDHVDEPKESDAHSSKAGHKRKS